MNCIRKSKAEGNLTNDEKEEQKLLRIEYIEAVPQEFARPAGFGSIFRTKDGSITDLGEKYWKSRRTLESGF